MVGIRAKLVPQVLNNNAYDRTGAELKNPGYRVTADHDEQKAAQLFEVDSLMGADSIDHYVGCISQQLRCSNGASCANKGHDQDCCDLQAGWRNEYEEPPDRPRQVTGLGEGFGSAASGMWWHYAASSAESWEETIS